MQKLKPENFSNLPENALKLLHKNRVTTILEFLQEDIVKLSKITKLDIANIITIRNEIFAKYSAPLINGVNLLDTEVNRRYIQSGIDNLDMLLKGGIPVGYITELCGLADSGKTQLCFQIAVNTVRGTGNTVLYVDTKGDFSAIRIQKMLETLQCSYEEMAMVMSKINVICIWSMDDLLKLLNNIKTKTIILENLAVIIIDSLPSLMFQFLGEENKMGLSLLNNFVNYSRYLARELNVAIICVNLQTRWVDQDVPDLEDDTTDQAAFKDIYTEKRNRCLGKYWRQIPVLVVILEKYEETDQNCSKIKVSLIKSNQSACKNRECTLILNTLGVT